MGTNYYLHSTAERSCPHCGGSLKDLGLENRPMHIGKASVGWCFALHVYADDELAEPWLKRGAPKNLYDWVDTFSLPNVLIVDEYGQDIRPDKMKAIITERGQLDAKHGDDGPVPHPYYSWAEFYSQNNAEPGPRGLLRQRINPRYGSGCIGHGAGTWDLVTGEFS